MSQGQGHEDEMYVSAEFFCSLIPIFKVVFQQMQAMAEIETGGTGKVKVVKGLTSESNTVTTNVT